MAYTRDDRFVTDALGRALAGAQVYYCSQPATVPSVAPPSPLATVYGTSTGGILPQPIITDGFGHCDVYVDPSQVYTIAVYHPLFGSNPVVLPDQSFVGGGGGAALIAYAGTLLGTQDGVNKVFTLSNAGTALTVSPVSAIVWDNFPLVQGTGYTLSGVTVTFTTAPGTSDTLWGQGFHA